MKNSKIAHFAIRSLFALVSILLIVIPRAAQCQILYGTLTGNITDTSGGAVPGAKVTAEDEGTGLSRTTVASKGGLFVITNLAPGSYKVTIEAKGFGPKSVEHAVVNANTVRRVNVSVAVAAQASEITVQADDTVLQTDRADINHQITGKQADSLPSINTTGRSFQALYKILPGFTPPTELNSVGANPQRSMSSFVNGNQQTSNNTRIEGASVDAGYLPRNAAYVPPIEAIETVNIAAGSFDAEQGNAGGASVNITLKSGTNQFHGAGWEYHTNSALKARDYFYCLYSCPGNPNQPPKNILNQYGGSMGGPILKNRLFFFSDVEQTQNRQAISSTVTIPTNSLQGGAFAGTGTTIYDPTTGTATGTGRTPFAGGTIPSSRIDPAAAYMAALLPTPNQSVFPNNYLATGDFSLDRLNADLKIDFAATPKFNTFARYSASSSSIFDPPSLGAAGGAAIDGGQPGNSTGWIQSGSLGGTYVITPTTVLDGVIGYTHLDLAGKDTDINQNYGLNQLRIPGTNGSDLLQGGYPAFTLTGFASLGNSTSSNPFQFRDSNTNMRVNLGAIRGKHSVRFGFDYAKSSINDFQPQTSFGPRGGFKFTGGLTALNGGSAPNLYNSWADFLLGLPQSMGKDVQYENPATARTPSYAFYARDQYQIARKLTIDYGVRYELYAAPTRDHYQAERYDPATNTVYRGGYNTGHGILAPRLGLAYRVTNKTVIRAGYGISSDPVGFYKLRNFYPATISTQYSGANSYQAAGSLRTGLPPVVGPDLSQSSFLLPTTVGTSTFPKDYNRGYIHSFNLTIQREFGKGFDLQTSYVGNIGVRMPANVQINAAGPGGGNTGRAFYAATGQTSDIQEYEPFKNSYYNALQSKLTRRLRDGLALGASYTYSKAIDYLDDNDSGLTFAWAPMYERNKALAGFDRTHNLQVYGTYELPFGKGKNWIRSGFLAQLIGGWQLNWVMSRTSGTPFTVTASSTSLNAPDNTQTAQQVVSSVSILGGHGSGAPYFNPTAFLPVTTVAFGNSGRNILRGPSVFNLDSSIFRVFRIGERVQIQFRAECFGLTNTPQFGNPNANVSNATFNSDGSLKSLGTYDQITSATGARQSRFAVKVLF